MKPKFQRLLRTCILPVPLTLAIGSSHAQTQVWDHAGATDVWDAGISANWDSGNTWTNNNTAQFDAGTDTSVTVSGTVEAASLSFGANWANDFSLIGDSIDFGASLGSIDSSAVSTTGGRKIYIQNNLIGSGGLTINAHGDLSASGGGNGAYLQFGGDNSGLTGGIAITGGLVDALTNNAFGSNQITLTNGGGILDANHNVTLTNDIIAGTGGGTIRLYGAAITTLSGNISGSSSLNHTDGGTLNLTGDMSGFEGTFNQQAGTTNFRNGATALTGTLTISGGTASIENTATNTYSAVNLNAGTLRIKSNNNALGTAVLNVGGSATLATQLGSSAITLTNNATIAGTSTLSVDAGYANITWNGEITGTGTTTRLNSSGTLTLGGTVNMGSGTVSNTSTGILNITGATVDTGTLNLSNNGSINLNSGTVTAETVSLNNQTGTLNIAGGILNVGYMNIGAGFNTSGRITQTGGTVNVTGSNGIRIGHWNNGGNPGSLYNISGGLLDVSTQTINVGWDGGGTLTVSGTGVVKAKRLYVDAGGADHPGIVNLMSGGRIEVGTNGTSNDGTEGSVLNLAGGTLAGVGSATWASRMDANASTASTLEIGSGFTVTQSSTISGSGSITKTGAGSLVFSAGNTFSGGLTISEGTLDARNTTALGTGSIVNNGLLYLNVSGSNSFTPTVTGSGNLQTSNTVTFGSGTNINLEGEAFRITTGSLTIQDGASVSIDGRVRLSNYNGSHRATTTVTGGSLITGDLTDNRDSWFDVVQSGGTVTSARLLSNQTDNGQNVGGTSGNSTYTLTGGQFITGGISGGTGAAWSRGITLNLGGGTLTASGDFTMSANTVNLTGTNGDVTIDTDIYTIGSSYGFSGDGGFIKAGSGTFNMTQAGTYSGVTAVSDGTLKVTNSLRNSSAFSVSNGATLELGSTNVFVGGHAVAMGDSRVITVDAANLLMNADFNARFGNVTLMNGSTWTSNRGLSNYDALLGDTDTGAATVTVTNTDGITSGSIMNGSGGIHLQGIQDFVVDNVTGDSNPDLTVSMILASQGSAGGSPGGIIKSGAGTMVLNARHTYTGGTTVNGGILQIDGGGGTATGAIRGSLTINDGAQVYLNQGDALGYGSGTDSISAININDGGVLHRIGGANETLGSVAITMDGGTISAQSADLGYDLFGGATTITVNNSTAEAGRESLISARIDLRQADSLFTVNENAVLRTDRIGDDGGTSLTKAGSGTMFIDGNNSFGQAVNVTGGTLRINGAHTGAGLFTVNSGATLGGSGSIAGAVDVSGVFSPGSSIESISTGTVSMLTGSSLEYEILNNSNTGADLLASAGDLNLTGLVTLQLNGTGTWTIGDKLTLISYLGSWNNGLFTYDGAELADDATLSFDGEIWSFNYDDTSKGNNFADEADGAYVTMTLIPEPSVTLLGSLGLLALLRRRR